MFQEINRTTIAKITAIGNNMPRTVHRILQTKMYMLDILSMHLVILDRIECHIRRVGACGVFTKETNEDTRVTDGVPLGLHLLPARGVASRDLE